MKSDSAEHTLAESKVYHDKIVDEQSIAGPLAHVSPFHGMSDLV